MPASVGSPLRTKERSARANTNGTTGRMHGLTIVSTPPTYATTNRSMGGSGLSLRLDRLEGHRHTVHAVPQAGRPRTVVEQMPAVTTAAEDVHRFPTHPHRNDGCWG